MHLSGHSGQIIIDSKKLFDSKNSGDIFLPIHGCWPPYYFDIEFFSKARSSPIVERKHDQCLAQDAVPYLDCTQPGR